MSLPMRPTDCFEAGRQTQTESSVKAPGRMRQMDVWSRDPLTCWTWIPNADGAKTLNSTQLRRAVLSGGLRGTAFPLDRYLSWMSPGRKATAALHLERCRASALGLNNYPPAKPGAFGCEPLKAAGRGR
jgi:hypothetical protein